MEKDFRRAVVVGCACVVFSRLTIEELKNYKNYHPEALKMVDEDDKSKVVFTIDIDEGPGHIFQDEAVFGDAETPDGHATITVLIDPAAEDKPGLIREKFGIALLRLEELEEQLISRMDDLNEEVQKIDGMICRP